MPIDMNHIQPLIDAMNAIEKREGRDKAYQFAMGGLNHMQRQHKRGHIIGKLFRLFRLTKTKRV